MASKCCVGFCHTTSESAINTRVSPPSWTSLPFPISSHASRLSVTEYRVELPVLHSSFPLAAYIRGNVSVSVLLSQFIPPSPPPNCLQVHSLQVCLCSCPAKEFISTIFLVPYICVNILYLFFWLTSLCRAGYRCIYLTATNSNAFLFMAV